jgi:hypothetical protein
MNAPRQKLDIDRTRERLGQLGCLYAAEQLDALLAEAVRNRCPPTSSSICCLVPRSRDARGGG